MPLDNAAINSRLLIVLVIIVGLISSVGVIISSVALGRPSTPDISISTNNHPISVDWLAAGAATNGNVGENSISKRDLTARFTRLEREHQAKAIWTLALGYDNGAHDYRSEDGSIGGFGVDLVEAVCAVMGLQCRIVFDHYQNCLTSSPGQYPSGGQGLFGQWYDACVGWSPNKHRLNVFNFSPSYTKPSSSKLFVKTGNKMSVVDLLKEPIGYVRGFASDELCLSDGKLNFVSSNIVYSNTPRELVQMLKDDKVSAIFISEDMMAKYLAEGELQPVEGSYQCVDDGYALMARKDNIFLSLWNEGMEKLKKNGVLKNLCKEAQSLHGLHGAIMCRED